ncbi:MAG: TonB-dependent receptor [Bacteroidales bacterium]|nr:TonB-dependent receptor [Bacteroidales bacterium]
MKIRYLLSFLFISCLLFTQASLQAQDATIRGFLYEEESGEPAIFANVILAGTNYGASTDVNGYFLISKIPPGEYSLLVTYLGFDTLREQVSLSAGTLLNKKYYVKKGSVELETVTVSAERTEARTETKMSVVKISPKDIKQIPSVGGQADFAQYLQVVPGVVFTGDQGGQFYIRGGSPIQNKVMLDGMTIYNPFHSIGLFSVFETDLIRNADIYTGGYNAEYGGRISSVMDITTKDGNKKRMSGAVGASTFGARAMIEGPLKKQNSPDEGSASFVLSFKNSYLAESSKVFYSYVDENGLPFNFADIYGKVTLSAANGSKVSLFGFNFTDKVNNYKAISDFGWNSFGGGSSFVVIPGRAPVLIEGLISYSKYETNVKSTTLNNRESSISGFNAAVNFTYFMGKNELKYGVELEGYKTIYKFRNYINAEINQTENTTQLGLYAKYKAIIGKVIIEPGFRLEWYASLAEASPEPRLAIKYNANDWFRLKFAGGIYSQNFIAASSDRDVVNLFYGFLSGPENLPSKFDGKEVTSRIQKADHLILGAEFDLSNRINLNVEGYYKYFPQLTNINRNKLYTEGEAPLGTPEVEYKDFILEKGNAYGLDMVLKYDYKKVYVWLVYSLGYVTRQYQDKYGEMVSYTPHFDRRHNVNFVFSYVTGPKREWEFGARWNLGTGFPFTQVQGFYESLTFPDGINSNVGTENGELGVIYGELYKGRLPVYHRLDLDIKRNFFFSANTKLVADISVTNVYDRKNVFYVDLVTNRVVYQLPIMPSLGLSLYF